MQTSILDQWTRKVHDTLNWDSKILSDKQLFWHEWAFTSSTNNLRLTPEGFKIFNEAKIKFFKCKIKKRLCLTGRIILSLKKLPCPYYISRLLTSIYFEDKSYAVLLTLYDGDLDLFTNGL
jgi:hypothetical protein